MSPRVRVFVKVGAFSFALFFIFYFVVYGYRYTDGVWFVTKNAFYEANFWSDDQQITFNNIAYDGTNKKIQLFSIDQGCYGVVFKGQTRNHCFHANSVTFDTFVEATWVISYQQTPFASCIKIDRKPHGKYAMNNVLYAKPVQTAFVARDIPFLQKGDMLFSCTQDYTSCHEVAPLQGEVLCSIPEWLVYHDKGLLYLMKLE